MPARSGLKFRVSGTVDGLRRSGALPPAVAGSGLTGTRYALVFTALAGLYVGAAKLGIEHSVAHGVITPVWAPTGIALAALVLFGPRLWPAVALGAFVANATSGAAVPEAAFIAVGNTLEAVVGSVLLLWVGFRPELDRVRDVLALIILGAIASTTLSATNGVTTLWIAGVVPGSSYGPEWLLWWIGDAMGDLIVAPLILVWAAAPLRKLERLKAVEALTLLVLLVGVSSLVFLGGYWRYPHLLFPLLVWAALRFQQRGAVTSSFVVVTIAVAGAVSGAMPLGDRSATEIVQILEGLLAAVAISSLILGAVLAERAATEEELERAHAVLAEAQAVAHIGSWEWSARSERVTWSDELYRLYWLEPQSVEMTYETFLERVHPDDREVIRRTIADAIQDGRPVGVEYRITLPDNRIRWHQARGRVIADETGAPLRMVGTAQDITERKRLDGLRDSILATVSHELRTPLTSIVGFALTLQAKGDEIAKETRSEMVAHLTAQARKLERLLSDLLDLDRLRHGLVRPGFRTRDVGRLVAEVAGAYPVDGHPVEVDVEPVLAEVDAAQVERIVENLLGNAIKHTPRGTDICVRVTRCDEGVLITVDDCGPGVSEEHRTAIFEIFNRGGTSDTPGTGIGLSLVAQFTAVHGGRVWVESNPSGGASFRVLLPTGAH